MQITGAWGPLNRRLILVLARYLIGIDKKHQSSRHVRQIAVESRENFAVERSSRTEPIDLELNSKCAGKKFQRFY